MRLFAVSGCSKCMTRMCDLQRQKYGAASGSPQTGSTAHAHFQPHYPPAHLTQPLRCAYSQHPYSGTLIAPTPALAQILSAPATPYSLPDPQEHTNHPPENPAPPLVNTLGGNPALTSYVLDSAAYPTHLNHALPYMTPFAGCTLTATDKPLTSPTPTCYLSNQP